MFWLDVFQTFFYLLFYILFTLNLFRGLSCLVYMIVCSDEENFTNISN